MRTTPALSASPLGGKNADSILRRIIKRAFRSPCEDILRSQCRKRFNPSQPDFRQVTTANYSRSGAARPGSLRRTGLLHFRQRDLRKQLQVDDHIQPPVQLKKRCRLLSWQHLVHYRYVIHPQRLHLLIHFQPVPHINHRVLVRQDTSLRPVHDTFPFLLSGIASSHQSRGQDGNRFKLISERPVETGELEKLNRRIAI